ncbi:hypothetical protein [Agitococcus lubricus]|uniref:Transposase n=1 Tax=Agitococcus lubricus TaxID=1077255 RepID=A0A2T5ITL6_9GAMM|nr:hypothetical protein [Agitococcus lubricus]PTQ87185.1 hypothetical protein C8N29_12120 [Agitococcus lubricus]
MSVEPKKNSKHYTDDEIRDICFDPANKQLSSTEMSQKYNVTSQSIRNWRKKYIWGDQEKNTGINKSGEFSPDINQSIFDSTPLKLIYPLRDGAIHIGIRPDQLLQYAVIGKIKLCFPVDPRTVPGSSATINLINTDKLPTVFAKFQMLHLDLVHYLVVGRDDCKKIQAQGFTENYIFPSGYLLLNDRVVHREPPVHTMSDLKQLHNFHLLARNGLLTAGNINISKVGVLQYIRQDMLFVTAEELKLLVDSESKRMAVRPESLEEYVLSKSKSSLLVDLDQAAFALWGDFNPIRALKYSKLDLVAAYLQENFHFFSINAKSAARMILPDPIQNPIVRNDFVYRARMLQELWEAWGSLCETINFQRDDQVRFDLDVEAWMQVRRSLIARDVKLLKTAQKLITPDFAPFHNPRRSAKK